MKRKPNPKRKRVTFRELLIKGGILALTATAIFAGVLFETAKQYAYYGMNQQESLFETKALQKLSQGIEPTPYNNIQALFNINTGFATVFPFLEVIEETQLIANHSKNCIAMSALLDENGNIILSNRERLLAVIKFSDPAKNPEDPTGGWYSCEPETIPEFYAEYQELNQNPYIELLRPMIFSAYVDKEHAKMIPHEYAFEIRESPLDDYSQEPKLTETRTLTVNENGYELVELKPYGVGKKDFPYIFATTFTGTERSTFDTLIKESEFFQPSSTDMSRGWDGIGETGRTYHYKAKLSIDGEEYTFCTMYQVDFWNEATQKVYFTIIRIFFLISLIFAYVRCKMKNAKNQAVYQFEDYQRTLTNNLAHDLKTPLTAISGYAENILDTYELDNQQREYLQMILENVARTDTVINRTLELNRLSQTQALQKSIVNLRTLAETAVEKYRSLSEEKQLSVNIDGQCELYGNAETLETAIENLTANAFRHSQENGEICITLCKNKIIFTNDIEKRVDTAELLMPFVKGDKSRSGQNGNGLGLSIAKEASAVNGLTLTISSTDTEFTAILKK
ncbi:MAG: HAMP domain-containing sensor histidine kinase [Oscillospiraceae bacterium]